jgi:hypothetical protein
MLEIEIRKGLPDLKRRKIQAANDTGKARAWLNAVQLSG